MITGTLKEWNYYLNKLPLYLQNSYGFDEHFKILFDLLVRVDSLEDDILNQFNILSSTYVAKDDILDKIAELFGVRRTFDVTYKEDNVTKQAALTLTNSELLKLIKAQIINNNYDGTYETSNQFYRTMNLPVYLLQSGNPGEVYVMLDNSVQLTENEQIMFLANLFTIKSMGIVYNTSIVEISSVMIWDSNDSNRYWDEGRWV